LRGWGWHAERWSLAPPPARDQHATVVATVVVVLLALAPSRRCRRRRRRRRLAATTPDPDPLLPSASLPLSSSTTRRVFPRTDIPKSLLSALLDGEMPLFIIVVVIFRQTDRIENLDINFRAINVAWRRATGARYFSRYAFRF